MLVFPDPSVSTEYTDPNGSVWEFNGTGWVRQPDCSDAGGGGGDFTLSAEADGDISSGASVVLNSDGSVSEIRLVTMPPSYEGDDAIPNAQGDRWKATYHPIADKIVCAYMGTSDYPYIVTADYADGKFVWGTPRVIRSQAHQTICKKLLVGTDGMIHGVFTAGSISYYFRYSIDGDALKQEVTPFYVFNPIMATAYDGVYNSFTNTTTWVATNDASPYDLLISTIDASGNATQQSVTGLYNAGTNKLKGAISYDEGQNKYLIANHDSLVVGTMAATTMSFSPLSSFQIYGWNAPVGLCFDPQSQTTLLVGSAVNRYGGGWDPDAVTASTLWAVVCTISPDGQSVTFSGADNIHKFRDCTPFLFYDSSSKQIVVAFEDIRGTPRLNRYIGLSIAADGSAIEIVEELSDLQMQALQSIDAFQEDGRYVYVAEARVRVGTTSINAPTADHKDFIGFASGDFADGEVAVIDAAGAVNNKQSGLSAGISYYVKKDGDLSDADTGVFAGTGVSDNEIQVRR